MACIEELITYFCEYDLYDNMLSNTIKDGQATDVLLSQCDFAFVSETMKVKKIEKIWKFLRGKLSSQAVQSKQLISQYVNDEISLSELFDSLPFKNRYFLNDPKEKVDEIQRVRTFFVYYPVFLIRKPQNKKAIQQPMLSFSCDLKDDGFQINKLFINKDIVSIIIAQQRGLEFVDARTIFGAEIDELAAAIDAIHPSNNFSELYQLVCAEFRRIFQADLGKFSNTEDWSMLEKASISIETPDNVTDSCFRDELHSVERFYKDNHILPETVQHYLGMGQKEAVDISSVDLTGFHVGSYQDEYPVSKKQWKLLQVADHAKLLCVEGPPGTGKTTLLKEIIADTLVKKADALLNVWEEEWKAPTEKDKGIYCSPLGGENLNSIIISSTNNKAIDNIGIELLKEIPFFSDFVDTISCDKEGAYKGSLCARLGRNDNIETFYQNFFEPFCRYLATYDVDPQDAKATKSHYFQLRRELDDVNDIISEFLVLRSRIEPIFSWKELQEHKNSLDQHIKVLDNQKQKLIQSIHTLKETQIQLKAQYQQLERDVLQHKKAQEERVEQLRILYSDLEQYERIGSIQRLFRFLLPKTNHLLKIYGSETQIRDMIQDLKNLQASYSEQIELEHQNLSQAAKQEEDIIEKITQFERDLAKNSQELGETLQKSKVLSKYQSCAIKLEHQLACPIDALLSMDVYELRNVEPLMRLRKKVFCGALRLFEVYIVLHKVPIKSNLKLFLTLKDGEGGSFYNCCQSLYNGDKPYSQDRAALVRTLWETFFLCFPVVTTTLHSFRKSIFQLIPDLFDVLMVDESGQIIPYYLVAPLYRMRRAIIVGDVNQIEPIKNVPPRLLEKKYTQYLGEEVYQHFCIDFASAQDFAVPASDYYQMVEDKMCGVVLDEHRRCESAIMAFSNQYVYRNVLKLKKENDLKKLFGTNLLAFDIRGFKEIQHYNQAEINACKEIVDVFVKTYGADIAKDIGIITPFRQQANRLKEAIPEVEVGTTHVFQGAEKKYILFSCVIDDTSRSDSLNRFVGGKGNLLNVAFSRAQKQFIYVGNLQAAKGANNYLKKAIEVIQQKGKVFSLFDTDAGEFTDDQDIIRVLAGMQKGNRTDVIGSYLQKTIPQGIITQPRLHNEILNKLLHMATQSIFVISPWIGSNVVTGDMLGKMTEMIQNGISIHIIFGYRAKNCSLADIDQLAEKDIPWRQKDSVKTIRALKDILGNSLKYDPPNHVKLLLVDDRYLFIGSLNWLYNSGKTDQKEISCLITNSDTIRYVKEKYLQ